MSLIAYQSPFLFCWPLFAQIRYGERVERIERRRGANGVIFPSPPVLNLDFHRKIELLSSAGTSFKQVLDDHMTPPIGPRHVDIVDGNQMNTCPGAESLKFSFNDKNPSLWTEAID